ncbi:DUF58 domain-containing protein [Gemmatimonas sp.]|uniref:DUF58 domain-containing protein n=1 Tax=Gemmatimonas sp. TaxID=1962908 RepID=UPI00286E6BCA|nr:DUF58 domain-containing protein [Gemmatimonas sp.]
MSPFLRRAMQALLRFAPQRRLAWLAAFTAPVWLLPAPFGAYVGVGVSLLAVAALAIDVLMLPSAAALSVEREFPPSVGIGDEIDGSYTVINRTSRALQVELHDQLPPLVSGGVQSIALRVPGASAQRVQAGIRGTARGTALLGTVGVRVSTALGLVSARYTFETDDAIRVMPSLAGVRRYRLLAMQHHLDAMGIRVLRHKGQGQAFARLREYVRGDDPRHIDWKATSKKGKFITREFTVERSQTVITLVDAGRGMTQLSGEFSRFEHALSAALILTDVASSSGDRVGTLVFDDEVRAFVPPQASKGALTLVRDAFIPVHATSREPDYASSFRFFAAHQKKRALVVFFTDVIDVRASQALLAHVTHSAARHLVLVVALRNDALFEAAAPMDAASTEQLFESAAAEEVIQAREAVLERMRRAGVVVLDVSPQTMTASVVNRYLELKARGAL